MRARRVGVERQALTPDPSFLDGVFACLGDRHRLHILYLLLQRPACVCELVEAVGLQQPTVSHHLAQMRAAGLVVYCREPPDRRWVRYTVNRKVLERLRDAVELWAERAIQASCRDDPPPRQVARRPGRGRPVRHQERIR